MGEVRFFSAGSGYCCYNVVKTELICDFRVYTEE